MITGLMAAATIAIAASVTTSAYKCEATPEKTAAADAAEESIRAKYGDSVMIRGKQTPIEEVAVAVYEFCHGTPAFSGSVKSIFSSYMEDFDLNEWLDYSAKVVPACLNR